MKDVADLSNHFNQLRVLRGMTPNQRLVATLELSKFTRALFAEGLRRRYPHLTDGEFDALIRSTAPSMSQQELLKRAIEALDASQTPYMLTGSSVSTSDLI